MKLSTMNWNCVDLRSENVKYESCFLFIKRSLHTHKENERRQHYTIEMRNPKKKKKSKWYISFVTKIHLSNLHNKCLFILIVIPNFSGRPFGKIMPLSVCMYMQPMKPVYAVKRFRRNVKYNLNLTVDIPLLDVFLPIQMSPMTSTNYKIWP